LTVLVPVLVVCGTNEINSPVRVETDGLGVGQVYVVVDPLASGQYVLLPAPLAPVAPVAPVGPVGPVSPGIPAALMFQDAKVPELPVVSTDITSVVPE